MRSDVIVSFGPDDDRTFHVDAMRDPAEARAWLDEQFLELDCEPLRASGKVLVADKLLAVADAAGAELFADAAWADQFARAAAGATGRSTVRIDVPTRTVNY
ncbi:MAG: hypothetical protein AB9M60_22205 [Leptothrix sp. (in: b-proteobacteria)]